MRQQVWRVLLLCTVWIMSDSSSATEEDQQFWYDNGYKQLKTVLSLPRLERRARSVVLLVGDGMGVSTVTAGRLYRGQQLGLSGEQYQLAFETFSHVGLAKTYNVNAQVGDSAACATALFCGVKTNYYQLGVDASTAGDKCTGGRRLSSLLDWAQQAGKSTGLITNTRLTHSTPSAAYAHVRSRFWESRSNHSHCLDIARQLVEDEPGRNIDVLMGGGRQSFLPALTADRRDGTRAGRADGKDLVRQWLAAQQRAGRRPAYVTDREQLKRVNPLHTDRVLGLFADSHMPFELDRDKRPGGQPSLAEMTVKAIQLLSQDPDGFLLIVEAGLIDFGHHVNSAKHALSEVAVLEAAVAATLRHLSLSHTLVVVTGDHSHVMTLGGSDALPRGSHVLGQDILPDKNGVQYTTLLYGNGPGYVENRQNISSVDTKSPNYRQESAVPLKYETHGGEDVPVYATGPWSHLFTGTYEQSYIAHAISFAACIGPRRKLCENYESEQRASCDISRPTAALLFSAVALVRFWPAA